jgi:NAD-dependent DNA ligase
MTNSFIHQSAAYRNDMNRSLSALLGMAQGMLCDRHLNDAEIQFLQEWLGQSESIAAVWPGNVVHARVRAVLEDGVVTEPERQHLTETLQQLIGGTLAELAESAHTTDIPFDHPASIVFPQSRFCLTGEFVYAPPEVCAAAIERRGGMISSSVTRKLNYLVVGGLGSEEWKHGSHGTKLEKALEYKREGAAILIVHEEQWASSL